MDGVEHLQGFCQGCLLLERGNNNIFFIFSLLLAIVGAFNKTKKIKNKKDHMAKTRRCNHSCLILRRLIGYMVTLPATPNQPDASRRSRLPTSVPPFSCYDCTEATVSPL